MEDWLPEGHLARFVARIVEPVFGLIKEQRGCRRFLLRGLTKVAAEWALLCAVTNLWRLYRYAPQAVGA
jgi:hypothetical protein